MKQDRPQRKPATVSQRRQSSASAILSGGGRIRREPGEVYTSYGWLLLIATFVTIVMISFLFTPFTHQLDEIKNVLLMLIPPFLLLAALYKMDFSAITWKNHGAFMLLGLYFVGMCLSWLVNPYKLVGETVVWFNLGVATFTVIFAWYMNSEMKARKVMIFFVLLGLASTLIGLFFYAGRFSENLRGIFGSNALMNTLFYTLSGSHSEMYSFILNSDFYAAFLVMLIPIALSMFFVEQRLRYKILALASLLLMFICLIFTNSNDSFIAISIAAPFYLILGWRYVRNWDLSRNFIVTFLTGCLLLVLLLTVLMLPKIAATLDFKQAAFEGRRVLWGGGFWPWIYGKHLDGSSPDFMSIIFGTGPGGYRHYFPWFRRPDFFDQQINNVTTFSHNFYLDVLLEQGLIGLVIFVGFVVRVFGDGIRQIRTTTSRTHLFYQLAVLTGILAISIQSFSSPNNRWAVAGMTYWAMFGLSMGLAALDNPPISGSNSERRIGGIPMFKLSWWASMALAVLFFARCVFPGMQFSDYWKGATLNAIGLRAMESVYQGMPETERKRYLETSQLAFAEAIKANPTFATSYYKLGHVYNQLERMNDAISTYEKLDDVWANYSEVQLNLGIMYAQRSGNIIKEGQKLQEDAKATLQEMQKATGARKKTLETKYAEQTEGLQTFIKNMETNRRKFMEIAYERMKEAAHQSLKPNTQFLAGSIGRELIAMYEESGEQEKADKIREEIKKYFRSLLNYTPKLDDASIQQDQKDYYPRAQKMLLALAQETHNDEEAIEVLKRMVTDNPDNDLMLQALLESFDRAGKTDDKLKYLEGAVHADPTDGGLRLELAKAYEKAGQQDKYLSELRRVEVLEPNDKDLLKRLYSASQSAGDPKATALYADKLTSAGISLADLETTPGNTSSTRSVANQAAAISTTATAPADLKTTAADEKSSTVEVPTAP